MKKSKVKSQKSKGKAKANQKIIFLVGPTGIGKSKVALKLAKRINAEIISCDSMQLYKGMRIVSSQPTARQLGAVKHHLVGIVAPSQEYDVSKYRRAAVEKVKEILEKGKIPLFVGGTGLYTTMLCDGLFEQKIGNLDIRRRLYRLAGKYGNDYLYKRLVKCDAAAGRRIHPNDTKRVVRALEVFEATGRPISCLQKERSGLRDGYDVRVFCLDMPRDKLYKRINERVEKMFKAGLVKEVSKLLKGRLSRTARYAIGMNELKGYFEGSYGLEEAKRLIKQNTRRYAKRQLTWFRKDKDIRWVEVEKRPRQLAEAIFDQLSSGL